MCVQPAFIIGTNNEDGTYNFAPITWVSVTNEKDDDYLLIISMFGTKKTKENVIRTGILSVNLVSTDMVGLMDYLGTHHGKDEKKTAFYTMFPGELLQMFLFWMPAGGYMNVKWLNLLKQELLPLFSVKLKMFKQTKRLCAQILLI